MKTQSKIDTVIYVIKLRKQRLTIDEISLKTGKSVTEICTILYTFFTLA